MAHQPIPTDGVGAFGSAEGAGTSVALNSARQMTTAVIEPASIKRSFRRPLFARGPGAMMRFATD